MTVRDVMLDTPWVYRAWQRPFADRKLEPILRHNDLRNARHVLDVGCGPGTNSKFFHGASYLGIDLNPAYVAAARAHHPGDFQVGDVTDLSVPEGAFDFVLANSLFHHIDDAGTKKALTTLDRALAPDGSVHILDLVLPPDRGTGRALARLDRGKYPRPLAVWKALFEEVFETVVFEPYRLGIGPWTLWNMVYFKGVSRRDTAATTGHEHA